MCNCTLDLIKGVCFMTVVTQGKSNLNLGTCTLNLSCLAVIRWWDCNSWKFVTH